MDQTIGPTVTLINADTDTASFTAPDVSSDTLLRFQLQVSDPGGLSDTGTASVTVIAAETAPSGGASGGGPISLVLLGMLGLAAARRALTRTGATL